MSRNIINPLSRRELVCELGMITVHQLFGLCLHIQPRGGEKGLPRDELGSLCFLHSRHISRAVNRGALPQKNVNGSFEECSKIVLVSITTQWIPPGLVEQFTKQLGPANVGPNPLVSFPRPFPPQQGPMTKLRVQSSTLDRNQTRWAIPVQVLFSGSKLCPRFGKSSSTDPDITEYHARSINS